jgi:tRNA(fMet)-specific endonuclease VapC
MVVDTGIFIDHLRAKDKTKTSLYGIFEREDLYLSSVTLYELMAGATSQTKKEDILLITSNFQVLEFSKAVAFRAAEIYQQLKKDNQLIEFRDIFIAATSLEFDYPVLTLNKKHFQRIKGLNLI